MTKMAKKNKPKIITIRAANLSMMIYSDDLFVLGGMVNICQILKGPLKGGVVGYLENGQT